MIISKNDLMHTSSLYIIARGLAVQLDFTTYVNQIDRSTAVTVYKLVLSLSLYTLTKSDTSCIYRKHIMLKNPARII